MRALKKLSGRLAKWPDSDRRALEAHFEQGEIDIFDDASKAVLAKERATDWSEASLENNIQYYTYFLMFLEQRGELMEESPSARATKKRLDAYLKKLDRVSPQTRLTYLRGVSNMIAVIDPNGDRRYLQKIVRRLSRLAKPTLDQSYLMISPSELFYAGIRRMDRTYSFASHSMRQASRFRDGLMMAALVCKALRRRNFAGMLLERNITLNVLDEYEVRFSAQETKMRKAINAQLSRQLTPYFNRWLTDIRPLLLNGRKSDALWVTINGTDMSGETFHSRFCKATEAELKQRINPHAVRKIVATGVAIARPELVTMVSSLLDHSNQASAAAYNLANQLSASERYLELLERRRSRALGDQSKRRRA